MSPAGRAVFVTGTDTGVGKTYVACGLARAWRAAGVDVGAVKPFASGAVKRGGRWTHDDVEALVRASGTTDSAEEVCPCLLRDPLAPSVAAAREGRRLDPARVARRVRRVIGRHARTVVEGAGGLLVPVTPRETMAEFAKRLGVPLLIVARPALGALNHTRLTVEAARARGLVVLGVVFSATAPGRPGLAELTNRRGLARHAGVPLLASIPWGAGMKEFARLAERVASAI